MMSFRNMSVADVLRSHARSLPAKLATIFCDRRTSYAELHSRTTKLANALATLGVENGDRLLWLGQNSDRLLELVLTAAKLGAVVCPANWRLSPVEMAYVIKDCEPAILFWQSEELETTVTQALKHSAYTGPRVRIDGDARQDQYEQLLMDGDDLDLEFEIAPDAPLLMIYTAAFAGSPQGALLSHEAILAQSMVMANLQQIDSAYIFLNSGPLFHVGVWLTTWPTFLMGGTNVFVRRVDAEELCQVIDRERCTGAYLVQSTQEQMVAVNQAGQYNLKSLHSHRGSAAWNAMITPGDNHWFNDFRCYGQTETMGMIAISGFSGPILGTHGRPSPVAQIRIIDDEGQELPVGEVGEIVVRGPTVMNGYHQRGAEPLARQITGWHRTNDLGRFEIDGSLSFIGPKQRMIKSGVENIYPAELESCIRKLHGVVDCAVIGVPDPKWIQTVKAIVVRGTGAAIVAEDVIAHCREHLASYKKPATVEFVEAIPKLGFGNDYEKLDAEYGGGNYPGGNTRSR